MNFHKVEKKVAVLSSVALFTYLPKTPLSYDL